jgi:hypothetical protein
MISFFLSLFEYLASVYTIDRDFPIEFELLGCRPAMFQLLDMVFKFPTVKLPDAAVTKCVNGTCDGKLMSTTEFHCVNGACESKVRSSLHSASHSVQLIPRAAAVAVFCWVMENRHCRGRRRRRRRRRASQGRAS